MSTAHMSTGSPRGLDDRRARGQGGFTLMEVLITVAISSVIMIPLLAWMMLGYRSQVEITRNSSRTAGRNLLASYLPRDVGSAAAIDGVPTDCSVVPVPPGPGGADRMVLSMVAAGVNPRRTVYLVRPADSTSAVLIRRTCDNGVVDDIQLVEDVALPISGSVTASCESSCNARFGRVTLAANLTEGRGSVSVTASRRIGADQ